MPEKLSIVIPVYNEAATIKEVIREVKGVKLDGMEKEIVIVDDGSTDGTRQILAALEGECRVFYHSQNLGKGAAVRKGFRESRGDFVIIQDGDLEYDPADYSSLIEPLKRGWADVVYGSRFISQKPRRVLFYHHYLANKLVTFISNIFTGLNLSDMETGSKAFNRRAIDQILPCLKSNGFGIEPEITAEVAYHKLKVYEVGISYHGRTYQEGKKINWRDGLAALGQILKFNLFRFHPPNQASPKV